MKHIFLNRFPALVVMTGFLFMTACADKWSEHYDAENYDLPNKTLNEQIKEHPDLSTFSRLLGISDYDNILDASQSYTVWAPINEALMGVDTSNTELVREIVRNHITRSRFTTSGIQDQTVRMLNGKYINFTREASGFSFGNKTVLEPNVSSINGLLHVIDGYAPYKSNLWEYIGRKENLDSLSTYLYSQSEKVFDPDNSTEIGVNEDGEAIYDSVFILTNPVLEEIGALDSEDSIYTAIMPDNAAWNEAYGRIESYYNFPEDAGMFQRQREYTQYTIVKDMIFRGYVLHPEEMDSLVSTTGSVFYDPGFIFADTEKDTLSNGLAHITNQMPYDDTLSWFKEIRVEAENPIGRENSSSNIFERNSYGTGLDVSNNQYIFVDPTSSSPSVEFAIPNTLSATYNIYCVFVPATIVGPTNTAVSKVNFKLTYIRRSSGSTFVKRITPDINTTNPSEMTKMLVAPFEFEYANVVDEDFDRTAVRLEVTNVVTTEEEQTGEFTRAMRIDCIILEPVTN